MSSALENTLSMNRSELSSYRYQPGRTGKESIYTVSGFYWCAKKTKPIYGGEDFEWEHHTDQFWAEKAGTIIWRAKE
jgi:hypothetical protein